MTRVRRRRWLGRGLWVGAGAVVAMAGCTGNIGDGGPGDEGPLGTETQPVCAGAIPGESQRLDVHELHNALVAVLGFDVDMSAAEFPTPISGAGFSTYPEANKVVAADVRDIADAADQVALQAMDHYDALLPCDAAQIDAACADAFIADFVPRALRGTYDAGDLDRFQALYAELQTGSDPLDPPLAIAGVISAVIQSPGFLYLAEIGTPTEEPTVRRLTDTEIANRLAFLFTDAPPDAELSAAVASGSLATPEGRRLQAERLLALPQARVVVTQFVREWVGAGSKDLSQRVTPEVALAFDEELRLLIEEAFFETGEGGLAKLVQGDTTYVNQSLAEHYGFADAPADDATWESVTRPAGMQAGMLSAGAVAAAHASDAETSVILRGRFVREGLLCDELGSPPPGAIDQNPVLPADATVREKIEARSEIELCAGCHVRMDLIGIGMEDIDNVGRLRDGYDDGNALDIDGLIIGLGEDDGATFAGTAALGDTLAGEVGRETLASCVMRQWYRYGMGREERDHCFAETFGEAFAEHGYDLRELLLSLAASEAFVLRLDEEGE